MTNDKFYVKLHLYKTRRFIKAIKLIDGVILFVSDANAFTHHAFILPISGTAAARWSPGVRRQLPGQLNI